MSQKSGTSARLATRQPQQPSVTPRARRGLAPTRVTGERKPPDDDPPATDPWSSSKLKLIEEHARLKEKLQRRQQQLADAILEVEKLEEEIPTLERGGKLDGEMDSQDMD